MENPNFLRKNLVLAIVISGLSIIAFTVGKPQIVGKICKSQKNLHSDYGMKVSVSQEILNLQEAFVNVAEEVKPSVVSICTEQVLKEVAPFDFFFADPFENFFDDFFGQSAPRTPNGKIPQKKDYIQRRISGAGSGVIIDEDGYILTNYHVVKNAEKIIVKFADNREYSGKIIGKDAKTDLAIIKIKSSKKLFVAKLGNSDKIRVGDWAIAIGSPFELEQTVTVGIISAKRQNIEAQGNIYRDAIQTDASINRGNSGGPLVNIYGEIVGINTAIYSQLGGSVGVGFAIPINRAKEILETLKTKGRVERGFLGIKIEEVDDVFAKQSGLKEKTGVVVTNVMSGLSADKSGIKRGDIILEFDSQKIESVERLQDAVAALSPNKKVDTVIWRDNLKKVVPVVLGEWVEEDIIPAGNLEKELDGETFTWLGMKVKQFTTDMAEEFSVSLDEKGIVIVDIENNSKLAEAGLYVRDIIKTINKNKTTTIPEFEKAIKNTSLSEGILFDINRGGNLIYKTYIEK
ncbi:MAG: Do family serine endopeptidase [Elusimicrobiota bacterium]